jgi:hypothetical protein
MGFEPTIAAGKRPQTYALPVWGSNPGGGEIFRTCPDLESLQDIQIAV